MADMAGLPIPPGGTIGIFGGGQLGKMLAIAAARLGYKTHMFAPDESGPLAQVASYRTIADDRDEKALEKFAASVDVVTYEFENVPVPSIRLLEQIVRVRPDARALEITQDRFHEKTFVREECGVRPTVFDRVDDIDQLKSLLEAKSLPRILKTRRWGYDGKGQVRIETPEEADTAWEKTGKHPAILEEMVDFDCEISVLIARAEDGGTRSYGPVLNEHGDHILQKSTYPAGLPDAMANEALAIGERIAASLDYVGVMAVEMFVVGPDLLFNEIAPRVHNSGHWTIEACPTCQFEQHIRAICGLPLGEAKPRFAAVMDNLIGDDISAWPDLLAESGTHVHLYGKKEIRPGRKLGHVTRLEPLGRANQ